MGTRSFVGMEIGGKIRAVYVHFDGYLEGVGAELQDYVGETEVEELISAGDRTSLGGPYYKDRGEDDVDPVDYDTFGDFFDACSGSGGEWYYVWRDGVWLCGNTYRGSPLYRELTPFRTAVAVWAEENQEA